MLGLTVGYFLSISILIFPFTFLGQNPSGQLFLCILRFISPLKQLKALLITYHHQVKRCQTASRNGLW